MHQGSMFRELEQATNLEVPRSDSEMTDPWSEQDPWQCPSAMKAAGRVQEKKAPKTIIVKNPFDDIKDQLMNRIPNPHPEENN